MVIFRIPLGTVDIIVSASFTAPSSIVTLESCLLSWAKEMEVETISVENTATQIYINFDRISNALV